MGAAPHHQQKEGVGQAHNSRERVVPHIFASGRPPTGPKTVPALVGRVGWLVGAAKFFDILGNKKL